jgi:hypothetical protein
MPLRSHQYPAVNFILPSLSSRANQHDCIGVKIIPPAKQSLQDASCAEKPLQGPRLTQMLPAWPIINEVMKKQSLSG